MSATPEVQLLEAVAVAAERLPLGHIERLAAVVAGFPRFDADATGPALAAVAGSSYRYEVRVFLDVWQEAPALSGEAVALALRAAARAREAAQAAQTLEVVWTGPTTHAVPVRKTREVLLDLMRLAQARLLVVSFAAYRVPEVLAELTSAVARGVDVRLVLEASEESRGRLSHDAADAFISLGGSVAFYVWPADQRVVSAGHSGVLHAKAVIADGRAAFVTSANLTGHALTANMELGLLVRGGTVPTRLDAHFDELIAQGVLRRLRNEG